MRNEMSLGRAILIMVAVGVALGVVYNAAGLMSRPPRGIPWLAARIAMADLDTLPTPPPGAGIAAAQEGAPPAAPSPNVSPGPSAGDPARAEAPPATHEPSGAGGATPAGSRARSTAPPAGSSPAASAEPSSPSGSRAAASGAVPPAQPRGTPAPFIPESDQPVRVKLATVKILFDTGGALFLDARDASEFEAGHIPGAMRLTREDALSEPDRVKGLPAGGRPIVAYCNGGECEASLELAQALVGAGYRKVLVYAGGFPEWVAAGYPVERAGAAK